MIKVVFLIRSLDRGGAERQLATLIRRLNKDRFDLTLITFYAGGTLSAELAAHKVQVLGLHKRGRWDVFGFLWRLIRELKKLRPDIIHSYLVEPNLVAVFIKPFFTSTKIVWGVRAANVDLTKYDWFARFNFRLQALVSGWPDLIIFNSNNGRAHHLALGFPPQRSLVIRPGVDTEEFRPDRPSGISIRRAWNIAEGTVLIGLVGRFDPMKDHQTFLKAAALLSGDVSDCRFVLVGDGPADYLANLRRAVAENRLSDRVVWAGPRGDMPAVYNALDIACSSSVSEGLPNAIAEAMACGLPCVVTDVGDSALLVGDTGIVVPPRDPQALAGGLKECVDNLRAGLAPNPRPRIITEFNVQRLVERTEAALDSLAQR
ncbi:MAG TPA: glycosyltransferase [Pyrinomonadaceae bacterium]|nr:glycosyltransferase [Pyrinomonadaceae bacterium]